MKNIEWQKILFEVADKAEKKYQLKLVIEKEVLLEISAKIGASIAGLNVKTPNVAKKAGIVTFWIRKLKPVYHHPDSTKKLLIVNEMIAFLVGLSICREYFDDNSRIKPAPFHTRIFSDWVNSLRYNSHSPSSSMISFELIGSHIPDK